MVLKKIIIRKTSQHQTAYDVDKQDYITEEDVEYPAKSLNFKNNTNAIIMGRNSEENCDLYTK